MSEQKKEMPSVTQRIRSVIDADYNGSVRAFCLAVGFPESQKVNRLFKIDARNGKYPTPSIDILSEISNKLGISLLWLQSGEGAILKDSNKTYSNFDNFGMGELLLAIRQHSEALSRHGEELKRQGERLDRMLDLVSPREKGAISAPTQSGLQKSPPLNAI